MINPWIFKQKRTKIRNSIKYSFWDGIFASIQFAIVDQFSTPIALYFGANGFGIGMLNFVRNSLVSIIQIFSANITYSLKSRKKLMTFSVFLAGMLWLPTYLLPFLFPHHRIMVFIVLFAVVSCLNMIAAPAWASLISEYVPYNKRGQFFGLRNTILGIVYCVSIIGGGLLLNFFEYHSLFWGFALLMTLASLSRLVSFGFLSQLYEPKWKVKPTHYFSFVQFLANFKNDNFTRSSVLMAFMMSGVSIASPFFAVYMLKELRIDYLGYSILIGAAVITTYLSQFYWGRYADKYGNMTILKLNTLLASVIPFLWLVSTNFEYLFCIQVFGGFIWAGLNLCSANFVYDSAIQARRERSISYFNFLSGLGLGVGALLGGYLFRHILPLHGSVFFSLFVLSGLVRFLAALCINLFTKEVRHVASIRVRELLFDLSGIRAINLLSRELIFRNKT
ncbi:MAG: MFS transporter [Candidatus Margulisiibacteriota bacterium]